MDRITEAVDSSIFVTPAKAGVQRKYQIVMPVKTGIQKRERVMHSGFRPRIKAFRGRLYAPE